MNNPFKLEFTLKQHTPIIHFQHDQEGATLRASEVKPKLDQFIIEQATNLKGYEAANMFMNATNEFVDEKRLLKNQGYNSLWRSWLVNKADTDHIALNYKIKVQRVTPRSIPEDSLRQSLYFGNIAKSEREKKHFSFIDQPFILEIFSVNSSLISKIVDVFPSLLNKSNFGARQSKGFGSFEAIEVNSPYKIEAINFASGTPVLQFDSSKDEDNFEKLFTVIDYYWKRLKSGINYSCTNGVRSTTPNTYHKSFLFGYSEEKRKNGSINYKWEKRWLKETFWGIPSDGIEKKFSRAFLGLPSAFEFKVAKNPCSIATGIEKAKCQNTISMKIEVKDSLEKISRIKSPITFKPIKIGNKWLVYIISNTMAERNVKEIVDYEFKFDPSLEVKFDTRKDTNGRVSYKSKACTAKQYADTYRKENEIQHLREFEDSDYDGKGTLQSIAGQADCFDALITKMKPEVLKTPNEYIDIKELLAHTNKLLGSTFTARDFTGRMTINVKLTY